MSLRARTRSELAAGALIALAFGSLVVQNQQAQDRSNRAEAASARQDAQINETLALLRITQEDAARARLEALAARRAAVTTQVEFDRAQSDRDTLICQNVATLKLLTRLTGASPMPAPSRLRGTLPRHPVNRAAQRQVLLDCQK